MARARLAGHYKCLCAEVDLQMKAEALAKCEITNGKEPGRQWRQPEVMAFLRTI